MSEIPTRVEASVRVAVTWRDSPAGLSGFFCTCPRTGRLMRLEECASCVHVERFRLGGGPAFIQCRAGPDETALDEAVSDQCVADIMSRELISVGLWLPIARLALLLVDENIGGVPVVDDVGRPVGMVSKTDILSELGDSMPEAPGRGECEEDVARPERTAEDLMTHPLVTIVESASIRQAAALMTSRRVHRLGVTDSENRLVGMVTMTDIVRRVAER